MSAPRSLTLGPRRRRSSTNRRGATTRAFCSIPARHDLARRVDANYLGGLVARHVVDLGDARAMGRALAYDLVKETYRFTTTPRQTTATVEGNGKARVTT